MVAFNTLANWRETMPNFETSAMLVELIDKVLGLVPQNPETSTRASALAKDVLLHQWPASNLIKVRNFLSNLSNSLVIFTSDTHQPCT